MSNKLIKRIKDNYTIPAESKLEISIKNLNILKIIMLVMATFGLIMNAIITIQNDTNIIRHIYYLSFLGLGILGYIGIKIAISFNNYYVNHVLIMMITCGFGFIFLIALAVSESYFSSIITFYIVFLMLVLFFEIPPTFYILLIGFYSALFTRISNENNLNFAIVFNNYLYCICSVYLAFYKRRNTVKSVKLRLQIEEQNKKLAVQNIELSHQKDSLLLNKQRLEDTVYTQSQKIQLQNERLIRIQNNTIISLSNLVENRDEDTGEHVLRTRDYVELIATKAYLSGKYPELNEEIIKLYLKAAPMHDIGKIVVPDAVLKKPGRLTPEEFELIKLHTVKGNKIVQDVLGAAEDKDYVRITQEIATSHHEKYDGSGYPYGLKGEDIPLSARIMAIADVFDALVSPRCYKEPFTVEDSMKIIEEGAGTHFDPELAKLFVNAKDEVVQILNKYQ